MKKYFLMMMMCSTCAFADDGGSSLSDGFIFGQKLETPLIETQNIEETWESNVYKISGYDEFDEVDVIVSPITKTVISIRGRKYLESEEDKKFADDLLRSLEAKYEGEPLWFDFLGFGSPGFLDRFGKCVSKNSAEQCRMASRFVKFFGDYSLMIESYLDNSKFVITMGFKEDSEKYKLYNALHDKEMGDLSQKRSQEFLIEKGDALLESLR